MIGIIKVKGVSMTPALNDGDYIITLKPRTPPRAGFIYVMMHERHGRIIKRLSHIDDQGAHYMSDNPEGSAGVIPAARITARAWLVVTPTGLKRLKLVIHKPA